MQLFKSLAEIQEILYVSDKFRNSQKILRLSTICHQHFIQCCDFFNNLFSITPRKLFGKYFHNIIIHSPISCRNFSGSSLNVENEERTFKTIKPISSKLKKNI